MTAGNPTASVSAGPHPTMLGGLGGAAARAGKVADGAGTAGALPEEGTSQAALVWRSFRGHRAAFVSLVVLGMVMAGCLLLPFVLPWGPNELDFTVLAATGPSSAHPLGTDAIGRDVLARLASAGRITLLIGFSVAAASAIAGALIGTVAGYFGGAVDRRLMWIVDVLLTIPPLPLLIAMSSVALAGKGPAAHLMAHIPMQWRIIGVMSLLGWMAISRVVRSQVIALRNQEFVEAAEALGATHTRVMVAHILPNTVSVLSVFTTLAVSSAIMTESSLSFLGLGIQPPTATWGNMLLDARDVFTALQYWWLTWFPAGLILITVLCVNFIGDGLRDAFDPKSRR